jgi:tetratricopeptide (TPR) repeat protein
MVYAVFAAALALAAQTTDESDRPFVEILQSTGAIDGPSEAGAAVPRWERMRLELRVENRLPVEIRDIEVEVALVSASGVGEEAAVIPGWTFKEVFADTAVPALEQAFVRIERELPARRTSPPADEIAYRAHIKSYRLSSPDIDTAIRLLGSSHASDQMAAFKSYELDATGDELKPKNPAALGRSLAQAIAALPDEPSPSDALRMLFAVRAIGTLQASSEVRMLLELPGNRDGRAWARAVIELATRMVSASERGEPRMRVLPTWARERTVITVRAQDTIEDAVRDAILRMGDIAVPSLLAEAHLGSVPGVRQRAQRLLHALGRSTVRSQLSLRDRGARLAVVEVLGEIGSPEPVPALVEMLRSRDVELRDAAMKAIKEIGAPAVDPLVAAMGTSNDDVIVKAVEGIGAEAHAELNKVAAGYGVVRDKNEDAHALLVRVQRHLFEAQRARLVQEIERSLELAREGSFTDAFDRLDDVFTQDQDLYMSYAKPIAEAYLARGKRLFARGDFDAAVSTLRTGLSIYRVHEAEDVLLKAQLALARGYLELDDLEKAEELLAEADPAYLNTETRLLEGKLLSLKAEHALAAGDYGKARSMVDRARAMNLEDDALQRADRRLMFAENLAIVVVMALMVPALGLAIAVFVRRRTEATRMKQLAIAIDEQRS